SRLRERRRRFGRERQKARTLHEVLDVQRGGEAGAAGRRQRVAWSGHIVAQRGGGVTAEEDGPRILDPAENLPGLAYIDVQVLRPVGRYHGDRLVEGLGDDQEPALLQRLRRHRGPRQGPLLTLQLGQNGTGEPARRRRDERRAVRIVLALRQDV